MTKWWWWWLPGWHKKWRLEKRRVEALSEITGERLQIELMAQRPRAVGDVLDNVRLQNVLTRLTEIEETAKQAVHEDQLDDLTDDADTQGLFIAYFCPANEIRIEGHLAIELMEWWGVPKSETNKLRELLVEQLERADRSALYALFQERNAWEEYRDDYEDEMRSYAWWLFGAIMILTPVAVIAFHFAARFAPLLVAGLLLAGTAGSCVSVIAKLPALEVSFSEKLDSYRRRILSRISVGAIASLIGCGLLGWGIIPISVQGQTFADVLKDCSNPCSAALRILILMAVAMLFGFSERALTSFEQSVFGDLSKSQKD